jgi:NADH-quinone oxidoreductase subunit N
MNAAANVSSLLPLAPELVLGIGAMLLLMLGAYRDERIVRVVDVAAILLLVTAGAIV